MRAQTRGTAGLLVMLGLCVACGGRSPRHAPIFSPHNELGARLTGTFVHEPQDGAAEGSGAIRLNITEFHPSWKGLWLYAEWAPAKELDHPLRQCVYEVVYWGEDIAVGLDVYELPDPPRYAGAWHDPRLLADLKEEDLIPRPACFLHFRRPQPGSMVGRTEGDACAGRGEGAVYARTRLEVMRDRIVWRDQDFDAQGRPLPGTSDTGDLYVKVADRPFR